MQLLIATQNKGKQEEFLDLLAGLPLELVMPQAVGLGGFDVEESGETFEANAELKARAFAKASGLYALADDSGLSVDALGGRPGVYSARYGGPGLDAAGRRHKLLEALSGNPVRTARFECVVALVHPRTLACICEVGTCPGYLTTEERGSGGFGYDALFIPDGYTQTFGELPNTVKHALSHRGRAVAKMIPHLLELME